MLKDLFYRVFKENRNFIGKSKSPILEIKALYAEKSREIICFALAALLIVSVIATDFTATAQGKDLTETPHVIMAGDTELAIVGSSIEANEVISEIKSRYGGGNEAVTAFVNPALTVKPKELLVGESEPKIMTVDNAVDSILAMNDTENPIFTVVINSALMRTETIPYDTENVKSSSMYEGETKVKTKGKDGKKLLIGSATYVNGKIVSSNIYESEILKEPVNQVIKVGTKERIVKGVATGDFTWPIPGYYSIGSGYGYRFGPVYGYEFHMGYDITGSYGASIVAADGGTVVTAGYHSSYGYQVVIDHGNGLQTRYAHNSSLNVKVGQKVSKGEVISYCGSTGASTGNHLHFEVLKNGSHTDPGEYL